MVTPQQIAQRLTNVTWYALDAQALSQSDSSARKLAERADIDGLAIDSLALDLLAEHRCSRKPSDQPEPDLGAALDSTCIADHAAHEIAESSGLFLPSVLDVGQQIAMIRCCRPAV